jgi:hypothetical protein
MKKFFWLALGLAIAVSFLGVQSVLSRYQTVPVTVAQISSTESVAPVELQGAVIFSDIAATAAPTATVLPTLFAPIITEQPQQAEPAATNVVGESITKAPMRTADQALLDKFIEAVSDKGTDVVTGVFVPGRFSLSVLQQPAGDASYVSTQDQTVTQFGSANAYGTIGLLAHNYLSGKMYFDLREGDNVIVVNGNGELALYRITRIERYQALSPTSVYSDFIDLTDPNRSKLTAGQVFQRVYAIENRVVFQTCIEANGDPSWGRIFVIGEKVSP